MGGHDLGTQRSSFRISSSFSDKTPRSGTQALGAVIWSDEKLTELWNKKRRSKSKKNIAPYKNWKVKVALERWESHFRLVERMESCKTPFSITN